MFSLSLRRGVLLSGAWRNGFKIVADLPPPLHQVVVRLQPEKEPFADAEVARQAQVGIRRHRALAQDQFRSGYGILSLRQRPHDGAGFAVDQRQ